MLQIVFIPHDKSQEKITGLLMRLPVVSRSLKLFSSWQFYEYYRRAWGFHNLVWTPVKSGHNLLRMVEIGLRWLPKLGVDTSPCPHAHRRAWYYIKRKKVSWIWSKYLLHAQKTWRKSKQKHSCETAVHDFLLIFYITYWLKCH